MLFFVFVTLQRAIACHYKRLHCELTLINVELASWEFPAHEVLDGGLSLHLVSLVCLLIKVKQIIFVQFGILKISI